MFLLLFSMGRRCLKISKKGLRRLPTVGTPSNKRQIQIIPSNNIPSLKSVISQANFAAQQNNFVRIPAPNLDKF